MGGLPLFFQHVASLCSFILLSLYYLEALTLTMVLLLFFVWFLIETSIVSLPERQNRGVFVFLFGGVFLFFLAKTWVFLFVFFEVSMFPILFLIVSWGYQIERFQAANYFLVYAFFCSLPFFVLLQYFLFFFSLSTTSGFYLLSTPLVVFLFLPFLVKLPFFLFHL